MKTAIEWLIEYCDRENWSIPNNIIDQAKEMEKEQIINSWNDSHISMMSAEQYYKETFKQP
jgi:hypothetical protein